MHKIDLSENKFQLQRFILLQIVFGLFVVLFTYKWAYKVTHLIEQNIVMNLFYGFIGFIILLIVHELIHRLLFILFSKGENLQLNTINDPSSCNSPIHVLIDGNLQQLC